MSMSSQRPPRSKSDSSGARPSSASADVSSSSKKSHRHSLNDSPSASAINSHGRSVLNHRLRSVLSHPFGLPLFYVLNKDKCFTHPSLFMELVNSILGTDDRNNRLTDDFVDVVEHNKFNTILQEVVLEWMKNPARDETQLTEALSVRLDTDAGAGFHSDSEAKVYYKRRPVPARIDVLSSPEHASSSKPSTPLAMIEVGRDDLDWWKKLDQNVKYLDSLGNGNQKDPRLGFDEPLLFAVLTIDGERTAMLRIKLGVFLCYRNDYTKKAGNGEDIRMALLSHFKTGVLKDASEAFGLLLRTISCFKRWREIHHASNGVYDYFSSSCCRVDTMVLRSYDSRFRPTNRTPQIYLSDACREIVEATVIARFPQNFDDTATFVKGDWSLYDDNFWSDDESLGQRGLLIIAMQYREGCHQARSAKAFLAVIDQLKLLHEKGFVHGDIRSFNTVFPQQDQNSNDGCLIDFDFGGPIGKTCYPEGYRQTLSDGYRIGKENREIEKWHDWHALGRLMFGVHTFDFSTVSDHMLRKFYELEKFWGNIKKEPTEEEIEGLKNTLIEIDEQAVTICPGVLFGDTLTGAGSRTPGTYIGATGSPPEKKKANYINDAA